MTHQVASSSVNPSRCSQRLPVSDQAVVINLCTGSHRASHELLSAQTTCSLLACGNATTGPCTFEASRLYLGITVAIGTDGFRVERRYLPSLGCLWRWIGTLVHEICAMVWIRDDSERAMLAPCVLASGLDWTRIRLCELCHYGTPWQSLSACVALVSAHCSQHLDAEPPPACHTNTVCDTETPPADVQTASPTCCRRTPSALNEVVDNQLALRAICFAVVIPTSPSSPCATSSSKLSEISPHNLLET